MSTIIFKEKRYNTHENESILDCFVRNNVEIAYSCKSGICQACLMKVISGKISTESQKGLKPSYIKAGYFLACQLFPTEDIEISSVNDEDTSFESSIIEKEYLNHNVVKLKLETNDCFDCYPGQYLTLVNSNKVTRSYSIANQPALDNFIELHIRIIPNGKMSHWLENEAKIGQTVKIRGPAGSCFYVKENSQKNPVILACTGTGLAPLYGILKDMLKQNHIGEIKLFHGALWEKDLYYVNVLKEYAATFSNFTYIPCILNSESESFYCKGNIEDIVIDELPENKKITKLYVCGAPDFVSSLKTKAFLAGLASKNIYSDSFLSTK